MLYATAAEVFKWLEEGQPIEVLEYTGLKDKNGTEIYEGDFIKDGERTLLVRWRQDLTSFALSSKDWAYDHYFGEAIDPGHCEVIGNIYEHPHLLNS